MAVLEQRGLKFSRDKLGEVFLTRGWVVDTLDEIMTVGNATELGFPEEDRDSEQLEGGAGRHLVTIRYRGIQGDTPSDREKWGGKISFREDPIESHPRFNEIKETYEGKLNDKGKVEWPEFLSEPTKSRSLKKNSNSANRRNPMFGAKTYPVRIGEVTHEYIRKTLPSDLMTRAGRVVENLPGGSGFETPEGYVYVMDGPEWNNDSGMGFRIKDHYRLVPKESYLAIVSVLLPDKS